MKNCTDYTGSENNSLKDCYVFIFYTVTIKKNPTGLKNMPFLGYKEKLCTATQSIDGQVSRRDPVNL